MINYFEPGLYFGLVLLCCSVALAILHHHFPWRIRAMDAPLTAGVLVLPFLLTLHSTPEPVLVLLPLGISLAGILSARQFLRYFNVVGQIYLVAAGMVTVFGLAWSASFLATIDVSLPTRLLLFTGLGCSIFTLPHLIGNSLIMAVVIGRPDRRRPSHPLPRAANLESPPKVSLHVPCYAEPPEVVIRTLNALSRQNYPNFEVLVIDNNTKDPALWKPLEAHCAILGERFRFFHVAPLEGAKAGALNFALDRTAPDTEIIGAIDADYVAQPDFLSRLAGYFADPKLGFVQTSHDYSGWKKSLYQRMCYWEYMPTYKLSLPALNEWTAGYTVGTMCLIRRKALEEAGRWATWCLTEDSELAIRIHALGYTSICMPDTFGRGLIPDTFADYKKQRFRWTAGPLQQFKKHAGLLLPSPLGRASKMNGAQKFFEFIHCTETAGNLFQLFVLLLSPLIGISIIVHGDTIPIPSILWVMIACGFPSGLALAWLRYRKLGATFKDMLYASLAALSLAHVRDVGALAGLFSGKPLAWTRTNKFRSCPKGLATLLSAKGEMLRGIATILVGGVFFAFHHGTHGDLVQIGFLLVCLSGIRYFASPLLAVLAERELVRQDKAPEIFALPTVEQKKLHARAA
jgi:cellulose synthase/poly-beta-1,6-N-acetylglucosamine synthase-like glycosyltransferase